MKVTDIKASITSQLALEAGYTDTDMTAAFEAYGRKVRTSHPVGSFDRAGRFTLNEKCGCGCNGYRTASRAYPHSENTHGRSALHVAGLFGAKPLNVKRLVKAIKLELNTPAETAHSEIHLRDEIKWALKKAV